MSIGGLKFEVVGQGKVHRIGAMHQGCSHVSASKLLPNDNIRHDPAADGEQEVELV